jgi:hypothetical protein
MERANRADSGQKRGPGEAAYGPFDSCGNDRYPKGGDRWAAPAAGACLRIERDRLKDGAVT